MFSPTLPVALNITEMLHFFCSGSLFSDGVSYGEVCCLKAWSTM